MKRYVLTLTIDFEAESEEDAVDQFMDYIRTDASRRDVAIEEVPA